MSDAVIIALIGAIAGGLPTLATIVSAILQDRANKRNFAKQSILNLINEDKIKKLDAACYLLLDYCKSKKLGLSLLGRITPMRAIKPIR